MEWKIEERKLIKEFEFANFKRAVEFVNKILPIAQDMNHHPDILIHSYKKVKIILFTHSEGKITEKDYNLSEKIDKLIN